MDSSRQLLLGIGVFFGGTILLYAMLQMEGSPTASTDKLAEIRSQTEPNTSTSDNNNSAKQVMLTADIETEIRILAEKRRERELRVTELDRRAKTFLEEQERAELLAMEKARLENQKYRNNAIEPMMDEQIGDDNAGSEQVARNSIVTKPVVIARKVEPEPTVELDTPQSRSQLELAKAEQAAAKQNTSIQANNDNKTMGKEKAATTTVVSTPQKPQSRTNSQTYIVQPGDGLIRLSRQYDVPLNAILKANGFNMNTSLAVGQEVIIPSSKQAEKLLLEAKSKSQTKLPPKASNNSKTVKDTVSKSLVNKAPASPSEYEVGQGDGLIKLARQYNVPVDVLAQANNISANSSLRVGQTLTIPSRKQVARLQREAAEKQVAQAAKREAQTRLNEARRKAKASEVEAQDSFGVQVALADNQQKADEVVKQMQAAGYKATTSQTSRGVRVIVGPERSKEAALALKDKLNADSKAGVSGAWVLGWR